MKAFKVLLLLSMLMALAIITLSATPDQEEPFVDDESNDVDETEETSTSTTTSLRGASRFLATRPTAAMTCDKYPRVCRAKGSSGRDCCKKKCVDTRTDRVNCGKCGKKCKYAEICCKGKCVNPRSDKKNCGGCSNKCNKGSSCAYGMCSYA